MALSNEFDVKIEKINDSYIKSKDNNLKFLIKKEFINWEISKNRKEKYFEKLFLKIYIIFIHFIFYFSPFNKSYLIGDRKNRPRFLIGKKINNNLKIMQLMSEAKNSDIILSGWGLRDWDLVLKYKKTIVKDLKIIFNNLITKNHDLKGKKYILVHIRRGDFLEVESFKKINFSNIIWVNSIKELCINILNYIKIK